MMVIVLVIVGLLGGAGYLLYVRPGTTANNPAGSTTSTSLTNQTTAISEEQAITLAMQHDLGSSAVVQVLVNSPYGTIVHVEVPPPQNVTSARVFVETGTVATVAAFEDVYFSPEFFNVSSVIIGHQINFTDQYGKVHTEEAFTYTMSRSTADRIGDWQVLKYLALDNPLSWYGGFMNSQQLDDYFINPTIASQFMAGG